MRARSMERHLNDLYLYSKDLPGLNYAFFPLHDEPEVNLCVYSKPYLNQIEAVRLFSHNLPVGMKLVVKEHPWTIGKRPLSYYQKLLEIPNVVLADPRVQSRELVNNARIVTLIAGSIGLEALIVRKPVVLLGQTPFSFLPSKMIRYADNPERLGHEIRDLLEHYECDEKALLCYVSAVIRDSVQIDFYTRLLGRTGVYSPDKPENGQETEDQEFDEQIKLTADYLKRRLNDFQLNKINNNARAV